jgi:hypothetical protein
MKSKVFALTVLAAVAGGCAGPRYGLTGNDAGGIFPWSPENQLDAQDIAEAHCARYNRYARITSIYPQPGAYIGFACSLQPPAVRYQRRIVLRRRG